MRIIKSQDGRMIINAEKAWSFSVHDINGKGAVWTIIADSWINEDSWRTIAEYSTEARALKVIDMLNEWLAIPQMNIDNHIRDTEYVEINGTYDLIGGKSDILQNFASKLNKMQCFQMPQDSEEV